METKREWLHCHACHNVQWDRRAYRDHLLRVHGEVARRGSDIPVRLEGRELEVVWASAHRSRTRGPACAACRREALWLPRVSDREAERRLKDNRARTARRHRAAACAREGAPATLTTPEALDKPEVPAADTRQVLLLGSAQADPLTPVPAVYTAPADSPRTIQRHRPRCQPVARAIPSPLLLFTTGSTPTPSHPITRFPPAVARGPAG